MGATGDSIDVVAFAPGVDAAQLDVPTDKGLLSISGERKPAQPNFGPDESRRKATATAPVRPSRMLLPVLRRAPVPVVCTVAYVRARAVVHASGLVR
jgi:hypothetical protein